MPNTGISNQAIIDQYGEYYIDNGQNIADLKTRPFRKFGSKEMFVVKPTNDTRLTGEEVLFSEILQSFQKTFTPKGSVTFKPLYVDLFQMKIDEEFMPHDLKTTYDGYMTNNNLDPTTWPFIKWFIEVYLLNRLDQDIEDKAIFKGKYAAPTSGVASSASTTMNGLRYLINKGIADAKITPIVTGALSNDPVTFVEQIEAFANGIDEEYRDETMKLNLAPKYFRLFKQGVRKKYNEHYNQVGDTVSIVDQENITLYPRKSMIGSDKFFCTPDYNLILGVKGFENKNVFEIEKSKRMVALYTEFFMGAGIWLPDLMFTNDRDTAL
jgi:hypothetical protein